jgi:hypothetical protein
MKISPNEITRPYAVIHFQRSRAAKSIYYVSSKEGIEVPDLFGGQSSEGEECISLGYELQDSDEGIKWFFSIAEVRTHFQLSSEHRGFGRYGDDALLIGASDSWNRLTFLFYEGLGNCTSQLLHLWDIGLLEDTVALAG